MEEKKSAQKNKSGNSKIITALIAVVIIAAFVISIIMIVNAQSFGEDAAEFMADKLGAAVGNLEAVAECMVEVPNEIEKAKEEGLSAKDTTVEVVRDILDMSNGEQKLEVLSAGISINNAQEIGDTYSALYIIKATAIFTVDMSKKSVTKENGKIIVILPEPECDIDIDETATKKLDEYSRAIFDGDSISGYTAYINSNREIRSNTEEVLSKYPYLQEKAKESARKSVCRLVKSVCGSDSEPDIRFANE